MSMQNNIEKTPEKPVVIVGGGWSGLATACYLASQNIPVTLIESAKQLGGRARKSTSRTQLLDNGQHLMIGAYQEMLSLLTLIGVKEEDVFVRTNQFLKLLNGKHLQTIIDLKLPSLPAPLNLLVGMLMSKGLSFKEKIQTLVHFNKLLKNDLTLQTDTTVSDWLNQADLPAPFVLLLDALCLAAMNTPIQQASALNFLNILRQTFNGPNGSTDLLIPAVNLGNVFPTPARLYLGSKQANILQPSRLTHLQEGGGYIKQLMTETQNIEASAVVLATPAHISTQFLKPFESCNELCYNLDQLQYEPITTVYLRYDANCRIPENMIGMMNSTSQWVFDRRLCDQPGMIAVVISSKGPHMDLDNKDLSLAIRNELAVLYPDWPKPNASWVIREKRATFSCTPDSNRHRPDCRTPINNLFLAGDYLVNNNEYLPATLETTIRNAKACAEEVINYLNQ